MTEQGNTPEGIESKDNAVRSDCHSLLDGATAETPTWLGDTERAVEEWNKGLTKEDLDHDRDAFVCPACGGLRKWKWGPPVEPDDCLSCNFSAEQEVPDIPERWRQMAIYWHSKSAT